MEPESRAVMSAASVGRGVGAGLGLAVGLPGVAVPAQVMAIFWPLSQWLPTWHA